MMRPWALVPIILACCAEDVDLAHLEHLEHEAERVRELPLLQQVPVRLISRPEYRAENAASVAGLSDEQLRELSETYGRLGFFPHDLDLRLTLANAADFAAAYYSEMSKRITIIGDVDDSTVVHETVHALQDQHFDLAVAGAGVTSDEDLARSAVIEGDAVLAEMRFFAFLEDFDLPQLPSWHRVFDLYRAGSNAQLAKRSPPFFSAYSTFAYAYGLEYCAYNLSGATYGNPLNERPAPFDWTREDELFRSGLPATTHEVLNVSLAAPVIPVGLDAVPAELAPAFEATGRDSLGEWYTFLLFVSPNGCTDCSGARAQAADWRGDRVLFVVDTATAARGLVWASAWANAASANQVGRVLRAHHGFVSDGEAPSQGTSGDGEPIWVERRGAIVVMVLNVPPDAAARLAEAAFAVPAAVHGARERQEQRPPAMVLQGRRASSVRAARD